VEREPDPSDSLRTFGAVVQSSAGTCGAEKYPKQAPARSLTSTRAELLGRYRGAALPDVPALRKALAHAEAVHALAPETVADPHRRSLLAAHLADGREPQPALVEPGTALRGELGTWRSALDSPSLAPHTPDLIKLPLDAAARWLRAHLAPLRQAVALLDTVASAGRRDNGLGSEHTLAAARAAVTAAHAAQRETAAFDAQAVTDRSLLGPWYRGLDTQADDLRHEAPSGVTGYEPAGELLRRGLDLTRQQPGPYATEQQRELLGRYVPEGHPATEALRTALDSARLIARLAPDTLTDPARRNSLVDVLADGRPEPRELLAQTEQIRRDLDLWRCARRVAEVPAAERQLVLRNIVDEGPGVHREDLLREAARFFGWARLGPDIRDALTTDIDALTAAGDLIESEGGLIPAEGS
jgi:hypothetical protein